MFNEFQYPLNHLFAVDVVTSHRRLAEILQTRAIAIRMQYRL